MHTDGLEQEGCSRFRTSSFIERTMACWKQLADHLVAISIALQGERLKFEQISVVGRRMSIQLTEQSLRKREREEKDIVALPKDRLSA